MIYNIGDKITVMNSKIGFGQYYKSKGEITKLFKDGTFEVTLDIKTINTPKTGWGGGSTTHRFSSEDILKSV